MDFSKRRDAVCGKFAENAAGEYRNIWYNMRLRCFQDNTEKAVVFLLA